MGILPQTISSDIYCRNRIDGPVRSLALVSKFLAIGVMSLYRRWWSALPPAPRRAASFP